MEERGREILLEDSDYLPVDRGDEVGKLGNGTKQLPSLSFQVVGAVEDCWKGRSWPEGLQNANRSSKDAHRLLTVPSNNDHLPVALASAISMLRYR